MNNFHIYEEVGRGKDSVVYKVSTSKTRLQPYLCSIGSQKEDCWVCRSQVRWKVPTAQSLKWGKWTSSAIFFFRTDMSNLVSKSVLCRFESSITLRIDTSWSSTTGMKREIIFGSSLSTVRAVIYYSWSNRIRNFQKRQSRSLAVTWHKACTICMQMALSTAT